MSVVNLPQPELGYWVCNCGCMTHRLRSDGKLECAACGDLGRRPGFYCPLPEGTVRAAADSDPTPFQTREDITEFALRRFADRINRGEFIGVIGMKADGGVAVSRKPDEFRTNEQRQWLRRRLREAYRLLIR